METRKSNFLSENDKSTYWNTGFLFPLNIFPKSETARMRSRLENLEKKWINNGLPLPLNTYKRVNSHLVCRLAYEIASNHKILNKVEGILGPDILLWSVEFFIKEPMTKQIVGMHQDLTYWGMGEIDNLVTAWVALSPATKNSGCMSFVNGSHKNPILPHTDTQNKYNVLSRSQEVDVQVKDIDKTSIVLETGQMSLHHGLMVHGSGPNSSSDRRIGVAIRYLNPKAKQLVAKRDYAMVVKGADRVGNFINVSPPTRDFTADSLAVYDEVRIAQAEALTAGATSEVNLYGEV
jgi:ectoine hydroxylase-related dioxygenase (phytanoyl-CoA dioxygenase family)